MSDKRRRRDGSSSGGRSDPGAEFARLGDLLPPEAGGAPVPSSGSDGLAAAGSPNAGDDVSRRAASVWAEVVGPEVAANARPVQLRDGRLVVTTSSSAWAQTLQLMSTMVVAGLNERLGSDAVKKAVFRHAGWDPAWEGGSLRSLEGPAPPSPAADGGLCAAEKVSSIDPALDSAGSPTGGSSQEEGVLSAEEKEALEEVERLELPPSVRDAIREAMKAGFVRAKQDSARS